MGYFAVAFMLMFKLLFSPHPHQLLNALKKTTKPTPADVCELFDLRLNRNESIRDSDYGAEEGKKNLNRSSVKEKV